MPTGVLPLIPPVQHAVQQDEQDDRYKPCLSSSLPRLPDVESVEAAEPVPFFYSVARIAKRWGLSEDKVTRVVEKYRDHPGLKDWGSLENVRKRKRRYSIIRIHPTLLQQIEADAEPRNRGSQ